MEDKARIFAEYPDFTVRIRENPPFYKPAICQKIITQENPLSTN
ncbi:MAG: hypothetical protein ACLSXD_11315 [Lawsonibacter sp.]|jgi:hypothetical protein